jgi:hypothetical protein
MLNASRYLEVGYTYHLPPRCHDHARASAV